MENCIIWESIQKLLISLEWSNDALELCPVCKNSRQEGHKTGCELYTAIQAIGSMLYS